MTIFIFVKSEGFTFTVHPWEQLWGWGSCGQDFVSMIWPYIVTISGVMDCNKLTLKNAKALTLHLLLMKQYPKLWFWSSCGRQNVSCLHKQFPNVLLSVCFLTIWALPLCKGIPANSKVQHSSQVSCANPDWCRPSNWVKAAHQVRRSRTYLLP